MAVASKGAGIGYRKTRERVPLFRQIHYPPVRGFCGLQIGGLLALGRLPLPWLKQHECGFFIQLLEQAEQCFRVRAHRSSYNKCLLLHDTPYDAPDKPSERVAWAILAASLRLHFVQ